MRSADPPPSAGLPRRHRGSQVRRLVAGALIVASLPVLWMIVGSGAAPASPAVLPYATDHGPGTTTTRSTTVYGSNTGAKGHKEGPVAVVLSFIGVIAVVVLVVTLGSISVRRRTGGNTTPAWWKGRGPPDQRNGTFG
jgi:hypothetical protein